MNSAIRELRQRLGDSQQAFATRLNLSVRAVANYEAGRPPTVSALFQLAMLASKSGHSDLSAVLSKSYAERLKGSTKPTDEDETALLRIVLCLFRNRDLVPLWPKIESDMISALEALAELASHPDVSLKTDLDDVREALTWAHARLRPRPSIKLQRLADERMGVTGESFPEAFIAVQQENRQLYIEYLEEMGLTSETAPKRNPPIVSFDIDGQHISLRSDLYVENEQAVPAADNQVVQKVKKRKPVK